MLARPRVLTGSAHSSRWGRRPLRRPDAPPLAVGAVGPGAWAARWSAVTGDGHSEGRVPSRRAGTPGEAVPSPSLFLRVPPPRTTGGCGLRLRVRDLLRGPPRPGLGLARSAPICASGEARAGPVPAASRRGPAPGGGAVGHRSASGGGRALRTAEQTRPCRHAPRVGRAPLLCGLQKGPVAPPAKHVQTGAMGAPSLRSGVDPHSLPPHMQTYLRGLAAHARQSPGWPWPVAVA